MHKTTDQLIAILNGNTRPFSKEKYRKVIKALTVLESFLPSHPSSPWPKEIRKSPFTSYLSTILIAWDGTIGASAAFGMVMTPYLKQYGKWLTGMKSPQQDLFRKLIKLNYLDEPAIIDIDELEQLLYRYGFRFQVNIKLGNGFHKIKTQDLLRLTGLAKSNRTKTVKLVAIDTIQDMTNEYEILSFTVEPGICIHIMTAPMKQ